MDTKNYSDYGFGAPGSGMFALPQKEGEKRTLQLIKISLFADNAAEMQMPS